MVVGALLGIIIAMNEGASNVGERNNSLQLLAYGLGLGLYLSYYAILESTTGRTLGKLITGTKVVDENGGPPSFGQVLGRTLCRCIPFEPFSFFSSDAVGWHDSLANTRVIKVR